MTIDSSETPDAYGKPKAPVQTRRPGQVIATDWSTLTENADWFAINKPAPLLIHPTRPDGETNLLDLIKEHYPDTAEQTVGILNRLDRETSGIVLFFRHSEAASRLGKMTMNRAFTKSYLALVHGVPPQEGTIDAPLDRVGDHQPSEIYVKRGVFPEGKPARTDYKLIETRNHPSLGEISLVKLILHTGRLHQIRVHMKHIGHYVIGDKLYGPDEQCYLKFIETGWTPALEEKLLIPRQALHAAELSFLWNGEKVTISAPLSGILKDFWEGLE